MYNNFQQPQSFQQPQGFGVPAQSNDWPFDQTLVSPNGFNFNPQNHPPVRFELLAQEIIPLIPTIICSIANEICQTAYQNTIRVYTFNQLSANNFVNGDFNQVVQLAVDSLSTIIKRRGSNVNAFNPNVDIPRECSNALVVKCSINVANSQALMRAVDPTTSRNVQMVIESYKNTIIEIEQLRTMAKNQFRGNIPIYDSSAAAQQGYPQNNGNNGFVHAQTSNHFGGNQNNAGFMGNQGFNQMQPSYPQTTQPRAAWGSPQPAEPVGRRSFEAPKVSLVQMVNGQLVNVPDPVSEPAPQPTNQYQTPVNSRFAPTAVVQEWSSSPPPVSYRQGIPTGCPPPPTEQTPQTFGFQTPEIRENGLSNSQKEVTDLSDLLKGIQPEFVTSGFPIEEVAIALGEEARWTPTPLQPFPLQFRFLSQKIVIKKISYKGRYYYIQQIHQQTEAEMDELRHRITPNTARDRAFMEILTEERAEVMADHSLEEGRTVATKLKAAGFKETPEQELAESILESSNKPKTELPNFTALTIAGLDRPAIEKLDSDGSKAWMDVGFVNDAIHTTRLRHNAMPTSKSRILRGRFLVPKTFVTKKDVSGIFDSLVKEKSFVMLAERINAAVEKTGVNRSIREFICEFDCYLTDLVNDFLKNRLTAGSIDSFSEDVSVLLGGHLRSTYGDLIHDAFCEFESTFFEKYLTRITDEVSLDNLKDTFDESDKEQTDEVFVLALENNFTVSSVRAHSSEMKIPAGPVVAGGFIYSITEDHPELLKFCENLYESFAKDGYQWKGHLLLTVDGKVFSVEESVFGDSRFNLRHFNTSHMLP